MKCNKCHQEKPLTEYNVNKRNKCGLQHYCKTCDYSITRKNRHKYKEYDKNYREQYNSLLGAGIYKLTNIINGDTYIGKSMGLKSRFQWHFSKNGGKNKNEWKVEVLEMCEPHNKTLLEKELFWIQKEKPTLNNHKIGLTPYLIKKYS
jgi:predicted GIY-YIG superfamily endonuclease